MKKFIIALLAMALSATTLALAQDNSQQNSNQKLQQDQANQSAENSVNGMNTSPHHTMTGIVSDNGRTLTSNDTAYRVSNPGTLKSYDNQQVTVKFQFNTEKNSIKINKVESGK